MKAGRKSTQAGRPQRTPSPRRRAADVPDRPQRTAEGAARAGRQRSGRPVEGHRDNRRDNRRDTRRDARRPHEPGPARRSPQTAPVPRPVDVPVRAKSANQAKARAKARKAKAPKVIRPPLRERLRERLWHRPWERLITRLSGVDLRPQALLARIPFVVLVISSLGIGLGFTLWLSTDAAGRSYEIGNARALNEALEQQKEALERDVLQAESAPALAEAARNLGMIPSKDTAHLVQDPAGNWVVVGQPKPAEGVPPPPLNTKLPDPKPPAPATPPPPPPLPAGAEVPTRVTPPGAAGVPPGAEVPVRLPTSTGLTAVPLGADGLPMTGLLPAGLQGAPVAPAPAADQALPAPVPNAALPAPVPNAVIPALEPNGTPPPPAPDGFVPPAPGAGVPAPVIPAPTIGVGQ